MGTIIRVNKQTVSPQPQHENAKAAVNKLQKHIWHFKPTVRLDFRKG